MVNSFIQGAISRSNRNRLLFSGFLILVVVGAAVLSYRYLFNFVRGPFPVTVEQIETISDIESHQEYYVTIENKDVFDSSYYYYTESGGVETITESYLIMLLDEKILLIEVDGSVDEDDLPISYTGSLVPIPERINREVITDIVSEDDRLEGLFLPYMLDASDFRGSGAIGLGIGGLALLGGLYGFFTGIGRNNNPDSHPIMKQLAQFGDPTLTREQIDQDMGENHKQFQTLHFTRRWLINTGSGTQITRYGDLMWVYKQVTQHRTNGIPTGKTYSAVIYDRFGMVITINAKEEQVEQLLETIYSYAPWAIYDHSPELVNAWNKNRVEFIAQVDQRKAQSGAQKIA
ncbi:MAG: hypothetical protein MUF87_12310 [Anaerolineae bacterium]|jgi:hypothetical protein|nr:hypothetical protein [Anaerolineae bacterium]